LVSLHRELANLGMQLLDLAIGFGVPADAGIEGARRASNAIFAFKAPSILRLVFVMICSVYQTERPISNLALGPQNGVHFSRNFGIPIRN
jgi:hypothetical protein